MDLLKRLQHPKFFKFDATIQFREGARTGLWCGVIIPVALILSHFKHDVINDEISDPSSQTKVLSVVIVTFSLYHQLFRCNPTFLNVFSVASFFLLCTSLQSLTVGSVSVTVIASVVIRCVYWFFETSVRAFPQSFSIGEALLVVQGAVTFFISTMFNCINAKEDHLTSSSFGQVFLIGTCFFLILTSQSPSFQELLPFCGLFLISNLFITFPLMSWVVKKNFLLWFLTDFILPSSTRVLLVIYWAVCTVMALTTVWMYGSRRNPIPVRLTILRKYFHGVVVAIYMPGILLDPELLFLASVFALSGFLFIEGVRLFNFEPVGPVLNKSLSKFLDSKDRGLLILTHIYLLVGCSLPIWIFPGTVANTKTDVLVLSSGIISLGIGDTAASIGGSLWGKTKLFNGSKSIEGATCSILAEIVFVFTLNYFGLVGVPGYFPWPRFIAASVVTSMIEAVTTQVDNLVLPLVMYIIFSV